MRRLSIEDLIPLIIIIIISVLLRSWYISSVYPPELWISPKIYLAQHGFLVIDPFVSPLTNLQRLTNHVSRYFLTPTVMRLFLPFVKGPWGILHILILSMVVWRMTRNKYAVYLASALTSFGPLGYVYSGMNLDGAMLAHLAYPLIFYLTYLMCSSTKKRRRYLVIILILSAWVLLTYKTLAIALMFIFAGIGIGHATLKNITRIQIRTLKKLRVLPNTSFLLFLSVLIFYYLITWGGMSEIFSDLLKLLFTSGVSLFKMIHTRHLPLDYVYEDPLFRFYYSIQIIIYASITILCLILLLKRLKDGKFDAKDVVSLSWFYGFTLSALAFAVIGFPDRIASHSAFFVAMLSAFYLPPAFDRKGVENMQKVDKNRKPYKSRRSGTIIWSITLILILALTISCLKAPKLQRVVFTQHEKFAIEWIKSNVSPNQIVFSDFRFGGIVFSFGNHTATETPYNEEDPAIHFIFYSKNMSETWLFCKARNYSFLVFTRTMMSNHVVVFNAETKPIPPSVIQAYLDSKYFALCYSNPDIMIFSPS